MFFLVACDGVLRRVVNLSGARVYLRVRHYFLFLTTRLSSHFKTFIFKKFKYSFFLWLLQRSCCFVVVFLKKCLLLLLLYNENSHSQVRFVVVKVQCSIERGASLSLSVRPSICCSVIIIWTKLTRQFLRFVVLEKEWNSIGIWFCKWNGMGGGIGSIWHVLLWWEQIVFLLFSRWLIGGS